MRLTEAQLTTLIQESVKRVLNEIGYHEKQKREVSDEEHEAWLRKKSEAKKRYYDSQKKDDKKSDSKAIDYYQYKHGDHPVMKKNCDHMDESETEWGDIYNPGGMGPAYQKYGIPDDVLYGDR